MIGMNWLKDFIENFIFEIIFVIVFSGGFFTLYITKIKNTINFKHVGINRVYKRGRDISNMQKAMRDARQIKLISFMPYNFLFAYKELIVQKIKEGCNMQILIGQKTSPVLVELCQIERHTDSDLVNQIPLVLNLLKGITKDAGHNAIGSIEVRTYNAEIRNPATICTKNNGQQSAFVTLSLPPKRSIDCLMLEYKDAKCKDVEAYFDAIWNRHSQDILLDSRS